MEYKTFKNNLRYITPLPPLRDWVISEEIVLEIFRQKAECKISTWQYNSDFPFHISCEKINMTDN